MDKYYEWVAGTGSFAPRSIMRQQITLNPGQSRELLNIDEKEGDLRFLMIEVTSENSSDNVHLIIDSDSFYFNYSMAEMQNYNLEKMIRDIPSLIVADPVANRYVVLFKPFPPLHFTEKLKIKIENRESEKVQVRYSLSYTEVIEGDH